jgi:hypothetical protein
LALALGLGDKVFALDQMVLVLGLSLPLHLQFGLEAQVALTALKDAADVGRVQRLLDLLL